MPNKTRTGVDASTRIDTPVKLAALVLPVMKSLLTVEVNTVALRLLFVLLVSSEGTTVVTVTILVRVATTSIISTVEVSLSVAVCVIVTVVSGMLSGISDLKTSTGIVVRPVAIETTVACSGHVGQGL